METLTPQKRVVAALRGEATDHVPVAPKIWVDFAAKATQTPIIDILQDPVIALDVIARAGAVLGFDAVRQFPFPARKIDAQGDTWFEVDKNGKQLGTIDLQGGLATQLFDSQDYNIEDPVTMAYFQHRHAPSPVVNSIQDAERLAVPDSDCFDALGWGAAQAAVVNTHGDHLCYIQDLNSATMSFYIALRGMENALFDLLDNPALVEAVMEKGAQISVARGRYWLDKGYKVFRLNDSAGNLSLMSAQHWKQFIFPRIKQVCDELHAYDKDALIYCHICGNILDIAEDLAETGLDCIGPLDPLGNFTVAQIRERVGNDIALMGGVNTLSLLNKTSEEVFAESTACLEQAGSQGGYVLSSGCVVPRETPHANLSAMVDAAQQFARTTG